MAGGSGEEVRVSGRFHVNTAHGLVRAARASMGITLVPAETVAQDVREGRLAKVSPRYRRDAGGVYALYPNRRQLSLAVSALIEFVRGKIRDNPTWEKVVEGK